MNRNSNFVWIIIIVLIVIGLIYWGVRSKVDDIVVTPTPIVDLNPVATTTPVLSTTATSTVEGTYVCLPHRDTSGPTTMECAFGIQLDNGTYYALDTSLLGTSTIDLVQTGNRIVIEGKLGTTTPQQISIYNIEGLIRVSDIGEAQ